MLFPTNRCAASAIFSVIGLKTEKLRVFFLLLRLKGVRQGEWYPNNCPKKNPNKHNLTNQPSKKKKQWISVSHVEKKDIQTWPKRNLSTISWSCSKCIRTTHVNTGFHPDLGFCLLYISHMHIYMHTCYLIWKCFKPKLVYHWWFEQDLGLGQHWCTGYSLLLLLIPWFLWNKTVIWTNPVYRPVTKHTCASWWLVLYEFSIGVGMKGWNWWGNWSGKTQSVFCKLLWTYYQILHK